MWWGCISGHIIKCEMVCVRSYIWYTCLCICKSSMCKVSFVQCSSLCQSLTYVEVDNTVFMGFHGCDHYETKNVYLLIFVYIMTSKSTIKLPYLPRLIFCGYHTTGKGGSFILKKMLMCLNLWNLHVLECWDIYINKTEYKEIKSHHMDDSLRNIT